LISDDPSLLLSSTCEEIHLEHVLCMDILYHLLHNQLRISHTSHPLHGKWATDYTSATWQGGGFSVSNGPSSISSQPYELPSLLAFYFHRMASDVFEVGSTSAQSPAIFTLPGTPNSAVCIVSTRETCTVLQGDEKTETRTWFYSHKQPLTSTDIGAIEGIQLYTRSRSGRLANEACDKTEAWFEICVLQFSRSDDPIVKPCTRLSSGWWSHQTQIKQSSSAFKSGEQFTRDHPLIRSLQPGAVISVQVCLGISGGIHVGVEGQLVVQFHHSGEGLSFAP